MSGNELDELLVDENEATVEESPRPAQQHAGDLAEEILNIAPSDRTKEYQVDLAPGNTEEIGELTGMLEAGQ